MLKSNELRLGSIIDFDGMKSVVKEIDNQGVVVFIKETDETEWIDLFQFTPISLTEEILLSIEGVKQLNEYQYKFNDWFIIERYTTKEKWSVRKVISEDSSILLCFIDFLHELQNITFSLTNKELEINL